MFLNIVLLFFSTSVLTQQTLMKEDFAFGSEIEMPANKSSVEIIVPEDVYRVSKYPMLVDLAIFNSKNEAVPHSILNTESQIIKKPLEARPLTLFPVYEIPDGLGDNFSNIKISTSEQGSITQITSGTPAGVSGAEKKKIVGFLIDASQIKTRIEKLQIQVTDLQDNMFLYLSLEGSQDLKSWYQIETDAVLAKFEINGEKINKNEIVLAQSSFPYYRISWKKTPVEFKIGSALAFISVDPEKVEQPMQWLPVTGIKINDDSGRVVFSYDTGGFFPIEGLKVKFVDQNSVARVSIFGANTLDGGWTPVQSVTFYSIAREGAPVSSLQTDISRQSFRYWRIELDSSIVGVGNQFPEVQWGWRPKKIRFLARGQAPFTLAYGSSKRINHPQADIMGIDSGTNIGIGNLKEKVVLGGPDKLVVETKTEAPWKKIVLWMVLVLGVVLLGSMAYQVKQKM